MEYPVNAFDIESERNKKPFVFYTIFVALFMISLHHNNAIIIIMQFFLCEFSRERFFTHLQILISLISNIRKVLCVPTLYFFSFDIMDVRASLCVPIVY